MTLTVRFVSFVQMLKAIHQNPVSSTILQTKVEKGFSIEVDSKVSALAVQVDGQILPTTIEPRGKVIGL